MFHGFDARFSIDVLFGGKPSLAKCDIKITRALHIYIYLTILILIIILIILILICEHILHPPRTAFPGRRPGKAVRGGCRVFERVTKFDKIDQIFLPFLRERVTKFYKSYKIF